MKLEDLSKQIKQTPGFPPVHLWNPDLCEGVKFNIDRNGEWFYQNSPLKKESLKILFASILKKENNFKSRIDGKLQEESLRDGCNNYIYYLRYFEAVLSNDKKILYGVATDYAELYPDAPYYWLLNKNNEIEKIGTTNIKKYSLNFELSK